MEKAILLTRQKGVVKGAMVKFTSSVLSLAIVWKRGRRRHPKDRHGESPGMPWCQQAIYKGRKKPV